MRHFLLTAATLCVGTLAANAFDFKEGDFYYNILSPSTVEVTHDGFADAETYPNESYDIPATVTAGGNTYTVVKIGEEAFQRSPMQSVTLPSTIQETGFAAFASCTNLLSIAFPEGFTFMGSATMYDCTHLEEVVLPGTLEYIGDHPFGYCNIQSINIPESLTSLPDRFIEQNPNLEEIYIPASIESIGEFAFFSCEKLKKITIDGELESVGGLAFANLPALEQLVLAKPESWFSVNFVDQMSSVFLNENCSMYDKDGNMVTELAIPEGVTTLATGVLSGYKNLKKIELSSTVTTVGEYALWDCAGLETLVVRGGSKNFGKFAFRNCDNLRVVDIEDLAAWCGSSFANGWASPTRYSKSISLNGVEIEDLVIPEGVETINGACFRACDKIKSVVLPESLQTIGSEAFFGCTGIRSVESNAIVPPAGCSFEEEVYAQAELLVPAEAIDDYMAADGWKEFAQIKTSAVGKVNADSYVSVKGRVITVSDAAGIAVYDTTGRIICAGNGTEVEVPAAGIYVVSVAGKNFKVSVR